MRLNVVRAPSRPSLPNPLSRSYIPVDGLKLNCESWKRFATYAIRGRSMKKVILAMVVSALFAPAGLSAATPYVAAPIRQFIDGFNTGDLKSAFDAYSKGDISIIDEFAPYRWLGPNAAHGWAD